MARPSDDDFTFIAVTVARRDKVSLLAEPDNHAALGVGFSWGNGKITGQDELSFAPIRSDWIPGKEMTTIGVEGEWEHRRSGGTTAGVLDPGPDGPRGRGWIRDMRRIDGHLYAVGMSRQAYMRDDGGAWHHIDADILSKPGEMVGLNAIDGFSRKEIYAVGLKGEIWRYTGARWFPVPSPTNVMLRAVRCIGEHVYIAGGSGVLLRGRMGNFKVLAMQRDEENLEAIDVLGDKIYVASMRKLYRLDGASLREVNTKLGEITAGSLSSGDGVLWSVGAKHLVWTDDGKKWNQVFT
jgi:hypothetical protein